MRAKFTNLRSRSGAPAMAETSRLCPGLASLIVRAPMRPGLALTPDDVVLVSRGCGPWNERMHTPRLFRCLPCTPRFWFMLPAERVGESAMAMCDEWGRSDEDGGRKRETRCLWLIPFNPGEALDSQIDSQEYVEALYEAAGVSLHVPERSERPPKRKSRDARVNAEEQEANELEDLRAELEETKAELEKTKQALGRAQRNAEQWRKGAQTAADALKRAAKEFEVVDEALDVVEEVED
ncbi:hypothetical protein C8J57DRAFT_1477999 [Mycena rebaudengoi]|nr:hypothetical protein C8J57DRAFT_1477999 [Mycena rebaudengoi]